MDIERIPSDAIVDRAIALVQSAESTILATELLSDEMQPLPERYRTVVCEKLRSGVLLQRIAFGTDEQLQKFHDINSVSKQGYSCWLSPAAFYQRMLIVDDEKMLFAVQLGTEKMFCFSSAPAVIQDFRNYFQWILSRESTVSQVL
ncbi:MAG TPA: hypothetical protein VJK52_02175 [Candidatus Nanoarchaeia archaeon]|nr:hypothetical protein [Candidatus Nanoarchaeia archaeon]